MRPIVFLGHCLGGLIIRQALCFAKREGRYQHIALATRSVMFFGTPHGGAKKKSLLDLARIQGLGRKAKMIDVLAKKTGDLTEIDEDFCRIAGNYTIVNFYQVQGQGRGNKALVAKPNAVTATDSESVGVNGDHLTMCQFKTREDNTFIKVCEVIDEAGKKILHPSTAPHGNTVEVTTTVVFTVEGKGYGR
ncbi:putative protein SERAC1 [Rosellinia necatrix]|uniref:DUF676 domain-containing protein n=1 Tax=Rosellinia necatrix TaxID=77044 RepID=A0A1S7UHC2_ROSNE|nr:putative protein SERAC1 [Rosellinia necatrix]